MYNNAVPVFVDEVTLLESMVVLVTVVSWATVDIVLGLSTDVNGLFKWEDL